MARPTMTSLIKRLRGLLNGDTKLTNDQLQELLDTWSFAVDAPLATQVPARTRHTAPGGDLEDGVLVYADGTTLLTLTTDYTVDLQRGIVTTVQPETRTLTLQGTAFDLNGAAADGWELLAMRFTTEFDYSDPSGQFKASQQHAMALTQAKAFRARSMLGGGW